MGACGCVHARNATNAGAPEDVDDASGWGLALGLLAAVGAGSQQAASHADGGSDSGSDGDMDI